ncbi:MAG: SLBB domain-containing protein [Alphaproteobacteria bacterium]|nr:SLBB domain-containing protein [Alphaproteobacteria bacterium]
MAIAQDSEPLASSGVTDSGYVIGVDDVIEVSLVGVADYRARVKVQADGTVLLPYVESVAAVDKTSLALSREIARRLVSAGYYVKPQVIVDIVSYTSRYVTVLGAVVSPGLVPVDRDYRLSEILARVGGTRANGADHVKLRRDNGEEMTLDLATLATGGDGTDPQVAPGDKIYVPDAEQFFIYGQVNAPGAYRVGSGMTVRQALARGGGLTPLGTEKRVKIFRNGAEVKGAGLESPVTPEDVVVVGERYF